MNPAASRPTGGPEKGLDILYGFSMKLCEGTFCHESGLTAFIV